MTADAPKNEANASARVKKPRGFRIALIILLALVILFGAGLYCLPYFIPVDLVRSIAKEQALANAGVDVDFTSLKFGWTSGLRIEGVSVALPKTNADPGPAQPLLTVDDIVVDVALRQLMSGKVVVSNVAVDGFSVRLKRDAQGNISLPEIPAPEAVERTAESAGASAETTETPSQKLGLPFMPEIEVHLIELSRGNLTFVDEATPMDVELGVDFLRIEGAALNDPFTITGKVVPYASTADRGVVDVTGSARLVKDLEFDPNGNADLALQMSDLPLGQYAAKLSLGDVLPAGQLNGRVAMSYNAGECRVEVGDLAFSGMTLGVGGQSLAVPDTTAGGELDYILNGDRLTFGGLKLVNALMNVGGQGWVSDPVKLAEGGDPSGDLDFTGSVDVDATLRLLEPFLPGDLVMPSSRSNLGFAGKATLAKSEAENAPVSGVVSVKVNQGDIAVADLIPGSRAAINLGGISLQAVAKFAEPLDINATVNMDEVPIAIELPDIDGPIQIKVKGGAAGQLLGDHIAAEVRLVDTEVAVPATPWSGALRIQNPQTRFAFDSTKDILVVDAINVVVNDTIKSGIRSAQFTGIMAGKPEGTLDGDLSMMFDSAKEILRPLVPGELQDLSGSVRAAARFQLQNGQADFSANLEADAFKAGYDDGSVKLAVESPKTNISLSAAATLENEFAVKLNGLRVVNSGLLLNFADNADNAAAARLGETVFQIAGTILPADPIVALSLLDVKSSGLAMNMSANGVQAASVTSGAWILRTAASAETPLIVPMPGVKDFQLPDIEAGIDNLVFNLHKDGAADASNLGNIRLVLGAEGYLGEPAGDKYPLVNFRKLEFAASAIAAQARAQVRLDNYHTNLVYGATLAPTRIRSLLAYLQIPPDLLNSAQATGSLSWNGSELTAKGNSKGGLQFASGDVSPFTLDYDFSGSYDPSAQMAKVVVRGLTGGVANSAGEAIVSLNAHPSTLTIGKSGATGLLDLRFNGAAPQTRTMALGFASLIPELRSVAETLQTTEAAGAYQAWVQLQGRDNQAAVLSVGGLWQGAALRINGTQFLAEPGSLGAALVGEYDYTARRVNLSSMSLKSDSAQLQAEGTVGAVIDVDQNGDIAGLSQIMANLRFVLSDLTRLSSVFPGVLPADLGLAGRVEGQFSAGGDMTNIAIQEGTVRFTGINGKVSNLSLSIPQGNATYGGTLSINPPGSFLVDGSGFEALRMINVAGGTASLTGALVEGRAVNDLSAAFTLQNGQLRLESARVSISGEPVGTAAAAGVIDFNQTKPAANLQIAVQSMPLEQFNAELSDFLTISRGYVNLPAQGGSATVSFIGLSEMDILQTLRLGNFNFATGPVTLNTGPKINQELDRARLLLKQEPKGDDSEDRIFTFQSISGTVEADGAGIISFPAAAPIRVIGENTGDFAISGTVNANYTLDLEAAVVGQLEKILTFSLPSIIPNLRSQSSDDQNQFMTRMNQNAANGHYKLRVSGSLDNPQISGIPELVARIITDIPLAAPFAILGGVLELGKDLPGALRDVPGNLLNTPENLTRGIGSILGGLTGGGSAAQSQQQSDDGFDAQPQQEQQQQQSPRDALRGLLRGGSR